MVQIWWHGTSYPLYSEDIAGTVLTAPLSTSTASGLNRGLNENAQLFGCSFLFRIPILTPMRLFGICRLTGNFSQFGWADDSKYIGNKRAKWLLQLLSRFFLMLVLHVVDVCFFLVLHLYTVYHASTVLYHWYRKCASRRLSSGLDEHPSARWSQKRERVSPRARLIHALHYHNTTENDVILVLTGGAWRTNETIDVVIVSEDDGHARPYFVVALIVGVDNSETQGQTDIVFRNAEKVNIDAIFLA